jgi:hypothetical protein
MWQWMLSQHEKDSPSKEAMIFVNDIRKGDVVDAVKQFGSNACHCPARGGWVSYLIYQSGQEHNIAFMLGHPFTYGAPQAMQIENGRKGSFGILKPEDYVVDVPIFFDPKIYAPYFLPLDMAYGKRTSDAELQEFLKDPDKDAWKAFTLRFRPGLAVGALKPPEIAVPNEMSQDFESYTKTRQSLDNLLTDADLKHNIQEVRDNRAKGGPGPQKFVPDGMSDAELPTLFGEEYTQYLKAKDSGRLYDKDGSLLTIQAAQSRLPRLKQAVLRLHVVRRDKFQPWTIYHFGFMYCVLLMPDGSEFHLGKCEPPGIQDLVRKSEEDRKADQVPAADQTQAGVH